MDTVVPEPNLCSSAGMLMSDDVFIVEDEPVARRALLYLMMSRGYTAMAFETAEDALSAAGRRGIPRVLLMDLNLPGMNGMDAIRQFERANSNVFTVLITAAGTEELNRLRGKHLVTCLPKPLDFGRLLTLIEKRHRSN